jgi:hypothetical protein
MTTAWLKPLRSSEADQLADMQKLPTAQVKFEPQCVAQYVDTDVQLMVPRQSSG